MFSIITSTNSSCSRGWLSVFFKVVFSASPTAAVAWSLKIEASSALHSAPGLSLVTLCVGIVTMSNSPISLFAGSTLYIYFIEVMQQRLKPYQKSIGHRVANFSDFEMLRKNN